MKYFWDPPGKVVGLNADIQRHRNELAKLDDHILRLEGHTDNMSIAALRTYRHLRCQLQQSFADILSQFARRKE